MRVFKSVLLILVTVIILFVAIKEIRNKEVNFKEFAAYEHRDTKDVITSLYIGPGNKFALYKRNENNNNFEVGLFSANGYNAVHYFGSLFNTGIIPFGLTSFPGAQKVWKTEIELINQTGDHGHANFGELKSKIKENIIFYPDTIQIGNLKYGKVNQDASYIQRLLERLDPGN